jgi:tripartite-type tricarboxylate transporter receptor subunit TctC
MRRLAIAVGTAAAWMVVATSQAQDWPNKPVRIIAPFAAGGGSDTLGRILATQLTEQLGAQFYVENRGGAGGLIGSAAAAKADPDGYTFVMSSIATHVIAPASSTSASFHPLKDFTHVAFIGGPPTVIAVHPNFGVKTLQDLITKIKTMQQPLPYVSPGPGTLGNLIAISLGQAARISLSHITYKGAGQAVTDLVAGHVPLGSITLTAALGHIRAGLIVPLAVSSANRLSGLPDVPTLKELGYPDLTATTWFAVSAPAGLPADIVLRLNREITRAIQSPAVQQRLKIEEIETENMSPSEFTKFVEDEIVRWTPIVKASPSNPN